MSWEAQIFSLNNLNSYVKRVQVYHVRETWILQRKSFPSAQRLCLHGASDYREIIHNKRVSEA